MIATDENGNLDKRLIVKNPDTDPSLKPEERKFLKFFLETINKARHPYKTEEELEDMKAVPGGEYYNIPLMQAETSTQLQNNGKGLVSWFKRKLEVAKNLKGEANAKLEGFLTEEHKKSMYGDEETRSKSREVYKMIDMFEYSDKPINREEALSKHDSLFFETNLESVLYSYMFVKERKKVVDSIFPQIKATIVTMLDEAHYQNLDIPHDTGYMLDFIKAKILNQTLTPEKFIPVQAKMRTLQKYTTFSTLMLSPKNGLFQLLEGEWKNWGKAFIKPMGEHQFGPKELKQAMKWIIGDTKNHFDIVSLGELINEKYGINDMDINTYDQRLRSNESGIINLQGKLL